MKNEEEAIETEETRREREQQANSGCSRHMLLHTSPPVESTNLQPSYPSSEVIPVPLFTFMVRWVDDKKENLAMAG